MTCAGHKLYAPKGIGFLIKKKHIKLFKFQEGAGQEQNIRPGTENVLYCAALGLSCEICQKELPRR